MSSISHDPQDRELQLSSTPFNDAQRLHFRVGCEYVDKLLREIEAILHSGDIESPFRRYLLDLSPAQGRVVEDYIRRLRAQLLRALTWQGLEPPPPTVPATRAIKVRLNFIDIALADMRPRGMRGSGPVAADTATELTGILGELASVAGQMMSYLSHDLDESYEQRVEKVASAGQGALLRQVEHVISSRGLVEFRPRLDLLLSRMEERTFEVAVFGRVSSGKSSFLNALLKTELLSVGVNPITAVPTRIQYGAEVKARVRIGNGALEEVTLAAFRSLVSECGNPGNQKGVRQALLTAPYPRLLEGIVLVDTPGLGSLALQGARETLAYLPSCDLALVLIDAGSTLNQEDIGTLRLLKEAGISATVLLSKADLIEQKERDPAIQYVKQQLQQQLRTAVEVFPISSLSTCSSLIDFLYTNLLEAQFQQSQLLKATSVENKLLSLRNDVAAALQTKLQRLENGRSTDSLSPAAAESKLLNISASLGGLDRTVEDRVLHLTVGGQRLLNEALALGADAVELKASSPVPLATYWSSLQRLVQQEVAELVSTIQSCTAKVLLLVRQVGQELDSSELPDEEEVLGLVRDAPRFEPTSTSGFVKAGLWPTLGKHATQRWLNKRLRRTLEPLITVELGSYGGVLDTWARNLLRQIRFTVDSSANVYRASLQRSQANVDPIEGAAFLRQDIRALQETS